MVRHAALWTLRAPLGLIGWLWSVRAEVGIFAVIALLGYYGERGLGRGGWYGAIALVAVVLLAWVFLEAAQGAKRGDAERHDG
jgi:hypothetical protein